MSGRRAGRSESDRGGHASQRGRPALDRGRQASARERILATAFGLFYAHGPRGVGVDRIVAESGVAKATFYTHFPRKDDLVLAYLERVDDIWLGQLRAAAQAAGERPCEQLVGMFDALSSACRREGYHGCAFINTAAESVPGTDVHTRTVAHKDTVRGWVRDLAGRAGAEDPDQLARQLTLLLDGGLAVGVLDVDPAAPDAAKAAARVLVESACAPDG
ncbi:MAG: TetR/AcrR family transcriptional regulator [Dermatophilaceae bacterium]